MPVLSGAGLGGIAGMFSWLLVPAYWRLAGLLTGRRVESVERADVTIWSLWGGFFGGIALGLLWIGEYEHLF